MQQQVSQLNISPDFAIFILILAVLAYAILLGQDKIKTLALSAYVGIVLATEAAPPLAQFLASQRWDWSGRIGEGIVQLVLFALPLLFLEVGHHSKRRGHHKPRNRMMITVLMAIATAFLIISYGSDFIGAVGIKDFLDQSTLATHIYRYKLAWTAAVPLLIVGQSFLHHHE